MVKPQTLKKIIEQHLNLKIKWQDKQFKALVDSKVIKNHILPKIVEKLGIPHRQKKDLYPLITISGDPISYKNRVIYLKMEPIQLQIKGKKHLYIF